MKRRVNVERVIGSNNAATREDAELVAAASDEVRDFDFSGIKYTSGAFADELINRLPAEQIDRIIASAPVHISKLFQAVRNRRVSA